MEMTAETFDAQMELINEAKPNILLVHELKGYTDNRKKRLKSSLTLEVL